MSVERLLNPESPPAGHRVQEPREIVASPLVLGGGEALRKDPGHRNWNQTIHHLFERRNDIRSSVYREVPAGGSIQLDPARLGSYTLRLDGNASIELKSPPRVPAAQGSERTRFWSIRVRVFYATEATVSWPSNVFGARGVGLAPGVDGEYILEDVSVLPGAPGAAGTSDIFDLMYDERTGEWFVAWHVRGAATADPGVKNPEAVDPDPAPGEPTPPGTEPGTPTDPDGPTDETYTDPETGEPVAPVLPEAKAGNLVALHDGAVSFSGDCGSNWQLIGGAPAGAADISSMSGVGSVVRTSTGDVLVSHNLQTWAEIDVRFSQSIDLALLNGGFETGDLTGWELISGTAPMVLDTVQPPQQGGSFYATSDLGDPNFEVSQSVELPATEGGEIVVSARVFTELSATAEFEVRAGWDGETYQFDADTQLAPYRDSLIGGYQTSDPISQVTVAGPSEFLYRLTFLNAYIDASYDGGHERFNEGISVTFDDITSGTWSGSYVESQVAPSTRNAGIAALNVMTSYGILKKSVEIVLTNSSRPDEAITLTFPEGWQCPWGRRRTYQYSSDPRWYFELSGNDGDLTGAYPYYLAFAPTGYSEIVTVPGTGGWNDVAITAPSSVGSPIEIVLRGIDQPVYFDDVRASIEYTNPGNVNAICRDLTNRRHLIATDTAILATSGASAVKIADAPITAARIAAHGETIVLSDPAGQIAISTDQGITWTTHATTHPVRQVFAHPAPCALLADGRVVTISTSGVQEYSSHPAGSWMTWAARAQRWLLTYPFGSVFSSQDLVTWEDLPDMPVSVDGGLRRIVAADIGRRIGWPDDGRDMFVQEAGQAWSLAPSISAPIVDLQEIK